METLLETTYQPTQEITYEDYNGLPFYYDDFLKKQVNREAELWYPPVKVELPKFIKPQVAPLSAGIWNMCRQFLP